MTLSDGARLIRPRFGRPLDFRRTLALYVEALNARDVPALSRRISDDDDICVLVRAGLHIRGKAAILDFYRRGFFAQAQWRYKASVLWSIESLDTAMGVVAGREGDREFLETLVFNRHDDGWRLVFVHHPEP